ncbi:MAG: ribosome-associated translation inhibitor RaiA [Kosmotoga sp.]|nr:MAG: ribosome-associated translation inhibitor RaiA [Kosmotoga sp.]
MDFDIYAKDLTVTEAMENHLEKKLSKAFKIFPEDRFIAMDVRISKVRQFFKVELTAHLSGFVVRVEEKGNDFYLVVDALANVFERRLKKYKDRSNVKRRASVREVADSLSGNDNDYEEDEEGLTISRKKRFSIKPMTLEEAVLQMEMLGHNFFVFRNADTDEINVLYTRKNSSLGLIEMEE